MKDDIRIEHDSMGEVEVPISALYGAQTQRALNNFTISDDPLPDAYIKALIMIKFSAAEANKQLHLLTPEQAEAIADSARELLENGLGNHFPVPILQTGSGTSTNMNVNEVISSLAAQRGVTVSANDHVNMGQSSNDVIPSALLVATTLQTQNRTIPALEQLASIIRAGAVNLQTIIKTGRTHLMDALPIRMSDEFEAWACQLDDCIKRFRDVILRLADLPLGGTAVGSGVNCHPEFTDRALAILNDLSGYQFRPMKSKFKGISSIDTPLELSGHLKTAACCLIKISNDLRMMNSGPITGLREIKLPPLQPGSSIMPDKVNPVIPEAVIMAAAKVIGNDTTVTLAAQHGNFQLNTMLPIAAACLLESGQLVSNSAETLGAKAIKELSINSEALQGFLEKNPVLVTALTPYIGYLRSAEIAKRARIERKTILEIAVEETDLGYERLTQLLNPQRLADGMNKQ